MKGKSEKPDTNTKSLMYLCHLKIWFQTSGYKGHACYHKSIARRGLPRDKWRRSLCRRLKTLQLRKQCKTHKTDPIQVKLYMEKIKILVKPLSFKMLKGWNMKTKKLVAIHMLEFTTHTINLSPVTIILGGNESKNVQESLSHLVAS